MKIALQLLGSTAGSVLFFGVLLFWPAGTFDYWQAWAFIAVFVVSTMGPTVHLAVRHPDAFQRRLRSGPMAETRAVQKLINIGILVAVVAVSVVSALDHRFGWSAVPTPVVIGGDVLVAAGIVLAYLVIAQNNYAAATITVEAGQELVSTGLYGVVRHPMYVGALIMTAGTPPALGSYWGLVVVVPSVLVFVARILDEEKAMRDELAGYDDYMEQVHYRLVPGVW
ncbi:methyltransferase family protein [Mycolicibacterium arenosum]|uniref:Isoprenylcysteine carboxylmethyltransferase family protein n=1 Tax=Mycolicibacterium arenosum TaxID=2952157 RepID=A0ABT1LVE1_9MYCO|nr:isoprenylcysteine carboxylmethyltransferase family protein [Mycolicibacterium sp. CAU 1645]MCP9270865.1 isoprenylcysteine carboxylmethyltransferase family protein [Mycolicibacterium sp. CAU 1645]